MANRNTSSQLMAALTMVIDMARERVDEIESGDTWGWGEPISELELTWRKEALQAVEEFVSDALMRSATRH